MASRGTCLASPELLLFPVKALCQLKLWVVAGAPPLGHAVFLVASRQRLNELVARNRQGSGRPGLSLGTSGRRGVEGWCVRCCRWPPRVEGQLQCVTAVAKPSAHLSTDGMLVYDERRVHAAGPAPPAAARCSSTAVRCCRPLCRQHTQLALQSRPPTLAKHRDRWNDAFRNALPTQTRASRVSV